MGSLRICGLLLAMLLSGCNSNGFLFTNVTEPLDVDFNDTPVVEDHNGKGQGNVKTVQYRVRFDWDSNGVGDIAREHGLEEVYYADLRTLSILGVWTQKFVYVYGRTAETAP